MPRSSQRAHLRALLKRVGAPHVNPAAVEAAFVHESAAKEGTDTGAAARTSNERLEFLGDAILGFLVAGRLYERYPDAREGELALRKSFLVSDAALAHTAERLGFGSLLVVGAGHGQAAPARSMLAGAFEAFVAVLWRAAGPEVVASFLDREHIIPRESTAETIDDPKTVLQEWTQKHYATTPVYADRAEGPPHARTFFAKVAVDGEPLADGIGPTKKEAQRAAAAVALEVLRKRYDDVAPRKLSGPAKSSARPPSKRHRP
jgi:ribonuclease-3